MMNIRIVDRALVVITELPQQPILSEFSKIADELFCAHFKGTIVFDLAISKGLTDRFVKAYFDGKSIDRSTLRVTSYKEIPENVVINQKIFFSEHKDILGTSMLSKAEVQELINY